MIDNGEIIDAKTILPLHNAKRTGRVRGAKNQAAASQPLDHDRFKMNRSWSLLRCFVA